MISGSSGCDKPSQRNWILCICRYVSRYTMHSNNKQNDRIHFFSPIRTFFIDPIRSSLPVLFSLSLSHLSLSFPIHSGSTSSSSISYHFFLLDILSIFHFHILNQTLLSWRTFSFYRTNQTVCEPNPLPPLPLSPFLYLSLSLFFIPLFFVHLLSFTLYWVDFIKFHEWKSNKKVEGEGNRRKEEKENTTSLKWNSARNELEGKNGRKYRKK